MIDKLREATKELHENIEKKNLAYLIINHKIKIDEYKLLLLQNYIAYAITEQQISNYIDIKNTLKSELLLEDLSALEINEDVIQKNILKFENLFTLNNTIESLGAKYVVDGSALGGVFIAKNIPLCKNLQELPKPIFFSGDRDQVKQWNSFSKTLKKDYSLEEENLAINKAKETFIFFSKVFSEVSL